MGENRWKDEGQRFSLGGFKALGAACAVARSFLRAAEAEGAPSAWTT